MSLLGNLSVFLHTQLAKFLVREMAHFSDGSFDKDKALLADELINAAWQATPLAMPLTRNINSNEQEAEFFCGKNICVKSGSFITNDSRIGENSYIGYGCAITNASIGRYVSIANNVSIGPGEHDPYKISTSALFYENPLMELVKGECIVGDDVWVGSDSIIRRGVKIGVGAVIGANSFVNRDVAPYSIVAGSPIKVIGQRFPPDVQARIMASRWWELPLNEARITVKSLSHEIALFDDRH